MYIENLVLELTRRCNMSCVHCLRGEGQDYDMREETLGTILYNVSEIGNVTFSGGEPSLVPHLISYFMRTAKAWDVTINNFYIATNGKQVSDDFIQALLDCWMVCQENEVSQVEISNSPYHEPIPKENIAKLKAFRFVDTKYTEGGRLSANGPHIEELLLAQGRARFNGLGRREPPEGLPIEKQGGQFIQIDRTEEGRLLVSEATLYINVHGEVILGCDWDYHTQHKHKVGEVLTMKENFNGVANKNTGGDYESNDIQLH